MNHLSMVRLWSWFCALSLYLSFFLLSFLPSLIFSSTFLVFFFNLPSISPSYFPSIVLSISCLKGRKERKNWKKNRRNDRTRCCWDDKVLQFGFGKLRKLDKNPNSPRILLKLSPSFLGSRLDSQPRPPSQSAKPLSQSGFQASQPGLPAGQPSLRASHPAS